MSAYYIRQLTAELAAANELVASLERDAAQRTENLENYEYQRQRADHLEAELAAAQKELAWCVCHGNQK